LNVNVVDVMGRVVFSETISASEFRLDVSRWPSGVYFIRIEREEMVCLQKFVKQ